MKPPRDPWDELATTLAIYIVLAALIAGYIIYVTHGAP